MKAIALVFVLVVLLIGYNIGLHTQQKQQETQKSDTVFIYIPSRGEYGYAQISSLLDAYLIKKIGQEWNTKKDSLAGAYLQAIINISDKNYKLNKNTKIHVDITNSLAEELIRIAKERKKKALRDE